MKARDYYNATHVVERIFKREGYDDLETGRDVHPERLREILLHTAKEEFVKIDEITTQETLEIWNAVAAGNPGTGTYEIDKAIRLLHFDAAERTTPQQIKGGDHENWGRHRIVRYWLNEIGTWIEEDLASDEIGRGPKI